MTKIENVGAQPHFVVSSKGPAGMTAERIGIALEEETAAEMTGTPPVYSDLNPDEDFGEGFYTGTQSTGTTVRLPVSLNAGSHVLVCFLPDIADGMPHAYKGMHTVVEVAG